MTLTSLRRALVVDDSRAMRKILGRILDEIGFEVHEACDGLDALRELDDLANVHLGLLDINMPNMDGIQLVREIRARPRLSGMRLMMVTSETDVAQMAAALEAGADEYATKPFDSMVILEKLKLIGLGEE